MGASFLQIVLAFLEKLVYTVFVPAGVMGSEGSAACGGLSDPSEWQRWKNSKKSVSLQNFSGTATGKDLLQRSNLQHLPV